MIGITRDKSSNVIPGVVIATALMPPLCTVGYGFATRKASIFLGAGYLSFINGFFIAIATLLVNKLLGIPSKNKDFNEEKRIKKFIIVSYIIVIIPSMISAIGFIKNTIDETNLNSFIDEELKNQYVISKDIDEKDDIIILVTLGETITNPQLQLLNKKLSDYNLGHKKLVIKQEENNISVLEQYMDSIKSNQSNIRSNYKSTTSEDIFNAKDIFEELKSIYHEISKIYMGYLDESSESKNDSNKSVPIIVVYSNDKTFEKIKKKLKIGLKQGETLMM